MAMAWLLGLSFNSLWHAMWEFLTGNSDETTKISTAILYALAMTLLTSIIAFLEVSVHTNKLKASDLER